MLSHFLVFQIYDEPFSVVVMGNNDVMDFRRICE